MDPLQDNSGPFTSYPDNRPAEAFDYLALVRKRYKLILLCVALGLGISAFHFFTQLPMYRSSMEVLVGQRSTGLVNNSGVGADMAGDGVVTRSDILATHLRILNSPMLLSEVHRRVEEEGYPAVSEAGLSENEFVGRVMENLVFDFPDPAASVVSVSYSDVDPMFAKETLELLYEGYRDYVDTHTESTGSKAIKLLTEALAENEDELREATREYQEYIAASPYLLEGESLTDMQHDRLRGTMQELSVFRTTAADLKSRLSVIKERLADGDLSEADQLALIGGSEDRLGMFLDLFNGGPPGTEDMATAAVREKYRDLVEQNLRVQALENDYGQDHPILQSLKQKIAITESFIRDNSSGTLEEGALQRMDPDELLESYQLLLENDYALASTRAAELEKESQLLLKSTKSVEGGYLKAAEMRSRIDRAKGRYEELSDRLQDINLTSNIMGFSSDVLSPPLAASKPFAPDPFRIFGIGCLLGLLAGAGLGYLAENLDRTFKDPDDLEASVGVSVVAHIPKFSIARNDRREAAASGVASQVRAFHSPQGLDAEGFRLLRTTLMLRSKDEPIQTIGITSANPSDGKSTVIANLAVSLAQLGKRVVLVDADLRRPTVQDTFGLDAGVGLSDCLLGEVEPADAAYQSAQENLFIMPDGKKVSNPAELLHSMRMEWLLEQLRGEYDIVLVDLPPILAVTDPMVLAPEMDGFLLAARITKNGRRPVESATKRIRSAGANILGIVVNGSEKKSANYGYSKYSDAYQYGYVKEYQKQYQSV